MMQFKNQTVGTKFNNQKKLMLQNWKKKKMKQFKIKVFGKLILTR